MYKDNYQNRIDNKILLDAKETRGVIQRILLSKFEVSVVMFTLNIPGSTKTNAVIYSVFRKVFLQFLLLCEKYGSVSFIERNLVTGPEAYVLISDKHSCYEIKRTLLSFEENHPLGRLLDLDVICKQGIKVSRSDLGEPLRSCYLCNRPAKICTREKNHSNGELFDYAMHEMLSYEGN